MDTLAVSFLNSSLACGHFLSHNFELSEHVRLWPFEELNTMLFKKLILVCTLKTNDLAAHDINEKKTTLDSVGEH